MRFRAVMAVVAVLCSGCGTLFGKQEWPVLFHSNVPVEFEVLDESGALVARRTTPASLILPASDGYLDPMNYTVRFAGRERGLDGETNIVVVANLVIPFLGYFCLLVVDPVTGCFFQMPDRCYLFVPPAKAIAAEEPATPEGGSE